MAWMLNVSLVYSHANVSGCQSNNKHLTVTLFESDIISYSKNSQFSMTVVITHYSHPPFSPPTTSLLSFFIYHLSSYLHACCHYSCYLNSEYYMQMELHFRNSFSSFFLFLFNLYQLSAVHSTQSLASQVLHIHLFNKLFCMVLTSSFGLLVYLA